MNNLYETPGSNVLEDADVEPLKPGLVLKSVLILFTLMAAVISFAWQLAVSGYLPAAIGGGMGPMIWGFLVVGLFQIGNRFRNTRSRYKIFLWAQVFFFVSGTVNYLAFIGQAADA